MIVVEFYEKWSGGWYVGGIGMSHYWRLLKEKDIDSRMLRLRKYRGLAAIKEFVRCIPILYVGYCPIAAPTAPKEE